VKENPRRAFSIGEKKILKRDHFFSSIRLGLKPVGGKLGGYVQDSDLIIQAASEVKCVINNSINSIEKYWK